MKKCGVVTYCGIGSEYGYGRHVHNVIQLVCLFTIQAKIQGKLTSNSPILLLSKIWSYCTFPNFRSYAMYLPLKF